MKPPADRSKLFFPLTSTDGRSHRRLALGLASAGFLLSLGCSLHASLWILRLGLLLVVCGTALAAFIGPNRHLLATPLFGLGISISLLFVLFPALCLLLNNIYPAGFSGILVARDLDHAYRWHDASGQRLVIAFAGGLLGLANLLSACANREARINYHTASSAGFLALIVFSFAVALIISRSAILLGGEWARSDALARYVGDGAMPVVALSTIMSVHAYLSCGRRYALLILGNIATLAASVNLFYSGKLPSFILIAAFAFYVSRGVTSYQKIMLGLAVVIVLGAASLVLVSNLKLYPKGYAAHIAETTGHADRVWVSFFTTAQVLGPLVQKFWIRQATTGACLEDLIDSRLERTPDHSPLYFLGGLVPRFLWPEKPSLSQSNLYALRYCGLAPGDVDPANPHSASVTLLGEPIVEAGTAGLVIGCLFILVLLGAVTWWGLASNSAPLIGSAALLPWMIDFDQSLAFYVANSVKSALYMALILCAAVILRSSLPRLDLRSRTGSGF